MKQKHTKYTQINTNKSTLALCTGCSAHRCTRLSFLHTCDGKMRIGFPAE